MGKILLFVSFVITLLSAVLGFLNHGKLSDAVAASETRQQDLTKLTGQLATMTADLKHKSDDMTAVSNARDQAIADLAASKSDLEKAKSDLNDATAAKATSDSDLTKTKADLDSANQRIKELTDAQPAATPANNEAAAKSQEQDTLIAKLQGDLDAAHSQLEVYKKKDTDRTNLTMRNGLEGRVLAVNPAWNFVVINLGDKNGVINNAELLVKRGQQLVGKVRITSVEPSTSIADIVANSVPAGITITPNDQVIYQAVEE